MNGRKEDMLIRRNHGRMASSTMFELIKAEKVFDNDKQGRIVDQKQW
jgi:hypothetical protein